MQFSLTIVTVVAAVASVSNAAVIPRANVNAGLAARYYANGVYSRDSVVEDAGIVARAVDDITKRAATADPAAGAPRIVRRRIHARDFRQGRVIV